MKEKGNMERFIGNLKEYKFNIVGSNKKNTDAILERNRKEIADAMKKYMPIGSIVQTDKSFKKFMIIGFNKMIDNKKYDYFACEYPFGVGKNYESIGFNHEQIKKVYYIGFVNEQERSFKSKLSGKDSESER